MMTLGAIAAGSPRVARKGMDGRTGGVREREGGEGGVESMISN